MGYGAARKDDPNRRNIEVVSVYHYSKQKIPGVDVDGLRSERKKRRVSDRLNWSASKEGVCP